MGGFERIWEVKGQNFQNNIEKYSNFSVHIVSDNCIDFSF